MKKSFVVAALFLSLLCALPTFAAKNSLALPIGGNFTDPTGATGTFTGTFNLQQFTVVNNQLMAVGTLTGTLTTAAGTVLGSVLQTIQLPVSTITGTCQILHLDLGPLSLNLLGLQVNLSEVVLDITAQSGPGNLLGNLLCAVANLLNGGSLSGVLNQIASLLNQILGILAGL